METRTAQSLDELESDVALLGEAHDASVAELAGEATLTLLRKLRDSAIALRAGELEGGRDAFAAQFHDLTIAELEMVARAFTQHFHLVNAAEEQHRIRTLRRRDLPGAPVAGSIADAVRTLAAAGVSAAEMQELLDRMFIMPVLTAHPTEARRRTVLDHLRVVADVLDRLDTGVLGHREKRGILERLRRTVMALFATEEARTEKPTPRDEIETSLSVFETTLLDVTPSVYHSLEDALASAYPDEALRVPSFLAWGSWVGGDRDGNPFVTAETTRTVFEHHRVSILDRYLRDVEVLHGRLSVSSRRVTDPAGLEPLIASLEVERERLPEVAVRARRYHEVEPWREKLWYVRARLGETRRRGEAAYVDASDYVADLRLLEETLEACGYQRLVRGSLRDARRRAEVFGFHLATLDIRQHSGVHEKAVAELLEVSGHPGYLEMDDAERTTLLTGLLERADLRPPASKAALSAPTRELLATLDIVARARREMGPEACERYVVSFTSSVSDLLEVLYLARAARLGPTELRPVPLLEQLEDLDRAAEIGEQMIDLWPVRAAIGDELEVMIGYSDAGKQIGYFASAVALRRAQLALADVAERRGVRLTIFHGRGGAIGRGGGPANRSVRAQPSRALRGRVRVTEQGETVTARYARRAIGRRDLEQLVHAVLVAALDERTPHDAEPLRARSVLFDTAADDARTAYAKLLEDPDRLARYAVTATPITRVTKLKIGSRPASRRPGLSFEDLRAIPWVFSWNQSRHGLPGWFGLGSALDGIIAREGLELARELYRDSPFFRALINNAQLALTRADIDVARCYSELADEDARGIFTLIHDEHERTVARVLEVVGGQQLLGNAPHLVATVKRRNPYVDVLSHTQIELLRRLYAATDDAEIERLGHASFITINGIAAGLQTAG